MPCGGIFPIKGSWVEAMEEKAPHPAKCWQCNKPGCDHWCEEWDTAIHGGCVEAFLKTEEGLLVLSHRHPVIVVKPDGEVVDLSLEANRSG
jgi:hypothetical protein